MMFKIKSLVHDIKDVPTAWIFEHFCKLPENLCGQDLKIKSLFNPSERTASMCIYYNADKETYKFKDFSTGKGGSAIDLVKELTQLPYHKASKLIIERYNDFVLHNNGGYDVQEFKQASKYKVSHYVFRSWTTQDQYFWTQFNIGSKLLDEHHVRPLSSYTMKKETDTGPMELTITGNYLYGYFTKAGELYKIYQPKTQDKKFLKIGSYLQGSEQLKGHKMLIITSSLKDLMSIKSLKLQVDVIAADSENSIISQNIIKEYKKKYSHMVVLFDNDPAGISAMQKYREQHEIPPVLLPMSKDISDSIRDYGAKEVRNRLVPLLNKNFK